MFKAFIFKVIKKAAFGWTHSPLTQGFSNSRLLTSWASIILHSGCWGGGGGVFLLCGRIFCRVPGLLPMDVSSTTNPTCDSLKYLWTLLDVPWWEKVPVVENHCTLESSHPIVIHPLFSTIKLLKLEGRGPVVLPSWVDYSCLGCPCSPFPSSLCCHPVSEKLLVLQILLQPWFKETDDQFSLVQQIFL